jgi:hypothetical protein
MRSSQLYRNVVLNIDCNTAPLAIVFLVDVITMGLLLYQRYYLSEFQMVRI